MTKLMIFDLDGTLLYTLEDLALATNQVLARHGYPTHPVGAYRYFVGSGLKMQVTRALPAHCRADEIVEPLMAEELAYYNEHLHDHTRPYPGMPEALRVLAGRGIGLGVVTNKPEQAALALLHAYFPGIPFCGVWGKREGSPLKPDPAGVHAIMAAAGVAPDEVLYFGDSDVDMHTAQNAGVTGCGVLWGYRTKEELENAGASCILHQVGELLTIVRE